MGVITLNEFKLPDPDGNLQQVQIKEALSLEEYYLALSINPVDPRELVMTKELVLARLEQEAYVVSKMIVNPKGYNTPDKIKQLPNHLEALKMNKTIMDVAFPENFFRELYGVQDESQEG